MERHLCPQVDKTQAQLGFRDLGCHRPYEVLINISVKEDTCFETLFDWLKMKMLGVFVHLPNSGKAVLFTAPA